MNADIFISYSRRDSEQAALLAERLRSSGANVWMDTAALAAADTWSAEIVNAIEKCSHFLVLLSADSVASTNVTKEVSLASESKKTIIPIVISHCELNSAMKYALAGLQKVSLHNEEALSRSFEKLGLCNRDSKIIKSQFVHQTSDSGFIRIAVLPFEDLSPNHDNEWFSDGLTNELISTLTSLSELHVIDKQTSKMYKGAKLSSKHIAHELDVRYLVTGEVRKAGEKIRIQATLLDTFDGKTLWDKKFIGTMEDIFEIQEKTAIDITEGLKLKLTPEEEKILEAKVTENVEAYELYLRAQQLQRIGTLESANETLKVVEKAILLDPLFAEAYVLKADVHMFLYRVYGQDPRHLIEAERDIKKSLEVKPDLIAAKRQFGLLCYRQGKNDESEALLLQCVKDDPKDHRNAETLANYYYDQGLHEKAIHYLEKAYECNPDGLTCIQLLCQIYQLDDSTPNELKYWAQKGLPLCQRMMQNEPHNDGTITTYGFFLLWVGQKDAAKKFTDEMPQLSDARSLFNKGMLYIHLLDYTAAAPAFMEALDKGFTWFGGFDSDDFQHEAFTEVLATVARKKAELAAHVQNSHIIPNG